MRARRVYATHQTPWQRAENVALITRERIDTYFDPKLKRAPVNHEQTPSAEGTQPD